MTIPMTPSSPPQADPRYARRAPTRLNINGGDVVVAPKDYDAFLFNAEKAIEMYRKPVGREERVSRFVSDLILPLYEWCDARRDQILACYLPIARVHVQVFILTKTTKFDFDLAEEVATLELGLSRAGWRIGVMMLPDGGPESLATFVDFDGALQLYA